MCRAYIQCILRGCPLKTWWDSVKYDVESLSQKHVQLRGELRGQLANPGSPWKWLLKQSVHYIKALSSYCAVQEFECAFTHAHRWTDKPPKWSHLLHQIVQFFLHIFPLWNRLFSNNCYDAWYLVLLNRCCRLRSVQAWDKDEVWQWNWLHGQLQQQPWHQEVHW